MQLPCISYVYKQTAKLILTNKDKAYALHMNTIRSIGKRAATEKWTSHQRIGVIAQDSTNIKSGIEHDYVTNTLTGGDETHCIFTLSHMFQSVAQQVRNTASSSILTDKGIPAGESQQQNNSILDNLPLAEEHLVFKFTVMDPNIKCSEIMASVNVNKVTPAVISAIMITLRDTLPMFGLTIGMETSDAAGCNWVLYCDTLSTHTFRDALPRQVIEKYSTIDFDVKCLMKDAMTKQYIVFIPDMPHLTKNIVTCLELLSSKQSKTWQSTC